jgi:hypothetical protein
MGCMLNSHRFCLAVRMGSARACSPRRGAVRDQPTVDEITPFANIKTFGISENMTVIGAQRRNYLLSGASQVKLETSVRLPWLEWRASAGYEHHGRCIAMPLCGSLS